MFIFYIMSDDVSNLSLLIGHTVSDEAVSSIFVWCRWLWGCSIWNAVSNEDEYDTVCLIWSDNALYPIALNLIWWNCIWHHIWSSDADVLSPDVESDDAASATLCLMLLLLFYLLYRVECWIWSIVSDVQMMHRVLDLSDKDALSNTYGLIIL